MTLDHATHGRDLQPLPQPTYWPMTFALGNMLVAWGLLTIWIMSAVGGILSVIGLAGWIADILREHAREHRQEQEAGS